MRHHLLAIPLILALLCSPAASADADGDRPLVQIAVMLDDSGSMQGLLRQARAQLWEIVGQASAMRRGGRQPRIQVALYHYGDVPFLASPLVGFTDDLDEVSRLLFAVNGGGGEERCGQVILNGLAQLAWSPRPDDLRLILIAGNEPFDQGPVDWRTAVQAATGRGITVTAIHCGSDRDGRSGRWADAAELGRGRYLCIDHDRALPAIVAPQDPDLRRLNDELNATYLPYGAAGAARQREQAAQDANALAADPGAFGKRAAVKAGSAYVNTGWDLVDALRADPAAADALRPEDLPAALRGLDPAGRRAAIAAAGERRAALQREIAGLGAERDRFVAAAEAALGGAATYGSAARQALGDLALAAGWTVDAGR